MRLASEDFILEQNCCMYTKKFCKTATLATGLYKNEKLAWLTISSINFSVPHSFQHVLLYLNAQLDVFRHFCT